MINRVQAFNTKNSYKQDFGMALKCKKGSRAAFNKLSRKWEFSEQQRVAKSVEEVTAARISDKHIDVLFKDAGKGQVSVGIYDKRGKLLRSDSGLRMTVNRDTTPHMFMTDLKRLNDNAQVEELKADLLRTVPDAEK